MSTHGNGVIPIGQPTPKQLLFALEYLQDFNATRAYRDVYGAKNDNVAAVEGHKLLRNPKIAPFLQRTLEKATADAEVTVDRILREIIRMAWVDIGEAYDEVGCLKALKDMPEDVRRAIVSIEVNELWEWEGEGDERERVQVGVVKKVRFADKKGANELLAKYRKMLVDRHEFGFSEDLLQLLNEGRARVANER